SSLASWNQPADRAAHVTRQSEGFGECFRQLAENGPGQVSRSALGLLLHLPQHLRDLTDGRDVPREPGEHPLLSWTRSGRADLRERLVEPSDEALLELRRSELLRSPAQLFWNDHLHVESAPLDRVPEAVAQAFLLEEWVRTVDGTLNDARRLFAVEA